MKSLCSIRRKYLNCLSSVHQFQIQHIHFQTLPVCQLALYSLYVSHRLYVNDLIVFNLYNQMNF
jgi:hypothetical protein